MRIYFTQELICLLHKISLLKLEVKNSFQFRADILNFTNLVNRSWGVSQRSTIKRCFVSCSKTTSSANNFIPGYQMAFQTDNQGRRF
jgi:hypothetical protein